MRRVLLAALAASTLAGCVRQAEPESPGEAAETLRQQGVPYTALHAALADQKLASPLVVKETALAGLALGSGPELARQKFGEPATTKVEPEGEWWTYDAAEGPHLKLLYAGKPAKLSQVQAWPGSAAETSTLVRVLDPAVRVSRKYGAPAKTLPLGATGAEVWVYPAADAAFVVTAPDDKDRRSVGAVVVGL